MEEKPNFTRQLSEHSMAALRTLENLDQHFQRMDNIVSNINDILNQEVVTLSELYKSKSKLAQLRGQLDKLQFEQVDSIVTSDLHSGKQLTKDLRKNLNRRIDGLREESTLIYDQILKKIGVLESIEEEPDHKNNYNNNNNNNNNFNTKEQEYDEYDDDEEELEPLSRLEMKEALLVLERIRQNHNLPEESRINIKNRVLNPDNYMIRLIRSANGNLHKLTQLFMREIEW